MVKLKCGCQVSEEGKFLLGDRCMYCYECTKLTTLHPFGDDRLEE